VKEAPDLTPDLLSRAVTSIGAGLLDLSNQTS